MNWFKEDEVIVGKDIRRKGDAARAAADLGQQMIRQGKEKAVAAEAATHEFAHSKTAVELGVPNTMGYRRNLFGRFKNAFVRFNTRSTESQIKIATAPDVLSESDKKVVRGALREQRKAR